ncbi:hypothetical protein N474_16975 [Pseudoalteromonas luteoviolacea CPMOR-2]|uniref:Uncharacterized protein n=1 Tax=Pseudoalteromonas luteoviolacea DSM 6061 TaxID=1365250 RepID=A0A161ZUV2_9GAMM|nr:hypothetical protein N475_20255 [Pseudoalteromonas luteoviolacea DSM 6061]KZN54895.1 hypothetical protein N474_16975 [Pseudoalteromonas luteoviolacea CPMOR-2]
MFTVCVKQIIALANALGSATIQLIIIGLVLSWLRWRRWYVVVLHYTAKKAL